MGRPDLLFRPPLDYPQRPDRHDHRPYRRLLPEPPRGHAPLRLARPRHDLARRPAGEGRGGGRLADAARPWVGCRPALPGAARRGGRARKPSLPRPRPDGDHRRNGRLDRPSRRAPRSRPYPTYLPRAPTRGRDARISSNLARRVRPLRVGGDTRALARSLGRARAAREPTLRPTYRACRPGARRDNGGRLRRRYTRRPDGPALEHRVPIGRRAGPGAVGRGHPARLSVRAPTHAVLKRRHHALAADGAAPAGGRAQEKLALRARRDTRLGRLPGAPDLLACVERPPGYAGANSRTTRPSLGMRMLTRGNRLAPPAPALSASGRRPPLSPPCRTRHSMFGWSTAPPSQRGGDRNRPLRTRTPAEHPALVLQVLEDAGRAHTAADAHGNEAVLRLTALHLVDELDGERGAGGTHGVAERDRPPVNVRLLEVQPNLAHHGQELCRERLIELDKVQVVHREAGYVEHLGDSDHRPYAHDLRPHPADGEPHKADEWREPAALGLLAVHDHDRGCPVGALGRVAGRDRAVLLKDGRELGKLLQRGVARALVALEGRLVVEHLAALVHPVVLHIEGHYLLVEEAAAHGLLGAGVAAQGDLVLVLARYLELLGDLLARKAQPHVHLRVGLDERRARGEVRHLDGCRHVLAAARQDGSGLTRHDPLGRVGDGL